MEPSRKSVARNRNTPSESDKPAEKSVPEPIVYAPGPNPPAYYPEPQPPAYYPGPNPPAYGPGSNPPGYCYGANSFGYGPGGNSNVFGMGHPGATSPPNYNPNPTGVINSPGFVPAPTPGWNAAAVCPPPYKPNPTGYIQSPGAFGYSPATAHVPVDTELGPLHVAQPTDAPATVNFVQQKSVNDIVLNKK